MQHALVVHERNCVEQLAEHRLYFEWLEIDLGILEDIQHVLTFDKVEGHVGGVVVFKDLMHTDDVRMFEFSETTRLLNEQANNRFELRLVRARPRLNQQTTTPAKCAGEALFDDNLPIKAVTRHVGDAESASV